MKYALLIYLDPAGSEGLTEQEGQAISDEYFAIADEPGMLGGEHLGALETATTVRVQNGDVLTTDGPFADTKEAVGGYFTLEADDLDAAIEIVAKIPAARLGGAIEIRPMATYW